MSKSIEDKIRGVYMRRGVLGLGFEGTTTPEEANSMQENGLVNAGSVRGTEMWIVDPKRTKGPIELEVESLNTKGKVMSENPAFSAPLYAAVRQGAKELAQALPAFPDSVRPVEEMGTLGNPTPHLVTDQIEYGHESDRGYEAMLDRAASIQREQDMEMERD